ncbi:DUF2637 domain-containing protein [Streptomyces sioyaensis]|uniref:DUF2637 domain-containing protein n=1 Tax=Streptomyces sioyaensis TaxID=67364 RepID=UPI0033FC1D63
MSRKRIRPDAAHARMTGWDYGAVVILASVGFVLSYDALRQVAVAIHVRPVLSYLFPVVVDGFIAYGVRAILLLRDRPFGARLYAWILFFVATGASLWANALHAITLNRKLPSSPSALHLADSIVGVLSTLAPLALAGSVHLWIIMARTADVSVPDQHTRRPGPVRGEVMLHEAVRAHRGNNAPGSSRELDPQPGPSAADGPKRFPADKQRTSVDSPFGPVACGLGEEEGAPSTLRSGAPSGVGGPDGPERQTTPDRSPDSTPSSGGESARSEDGSAHANVQSPPVPDGSDAPQDREPVDAWMKELLPIAREASRIAGRISRSAVQHAVRARQPISNDRLGELLAQLREEEEQARTLTPTGTGSLPW